MRILLYIGLFSLLAGCGRKQAAVQAPAPSTDGAQVSSAKIEPATAAADAPATSPAVRPASTIFIDKKPYAFPPALLHIHTRDGQLTATLMSDDPKEAIGENYHGNSFYIEMPLDSNDLAALSNNPYVYSSHTSERRDSPNGIFLDGNRYQLQPADMQVQFSEYSPSMTLILSGQFLFFDVNDDTTPPQRVSVVAKLDTDVKAK